MPIFNKNVYDMPILFKAVESTPPADFPAEGVSQPLAFRCCVAAWESNSEHGKHERGRTAAPTQHQAGSRLLPR
jgi:hypothetical protein